MTKYINKEPYTIEAGKRILKNGNVIRHTGENSDKFSFKISPLVDVYGKILKDSNTLIMTEYLYSFEETWPSKEYFMQALRIAREIGMEQGKTVIVSNSIRKQYDLVNHVRVNDNINMPMSLEELDKIAKIKSSVTIAPDVNSFDVSYYDKHPKSGQVRVIREKADSIYLYSKVDTIFDVNKIKVIGAVEVHNADKVYNKELKENYEHYDFSSVTLTGDKTDLIYIENDYNSLVANEEFKPMNGNTDVVQYLRNESAIISSDVLKKSYEKGNVKISLQYINRVIRFTKDIIERLKKLPNEQEVQDYIERYNYSDRYNKLYGRIDDMLEIHKFIYENEDARQESRHIPSLKDANETIKYIKENRHVLEDALAKNKENKLSIEAK